MKPGPTRRSALGQLAAGPLSACAAPGSAKALRFWAMGREGEVVRGLAAGIERAQPGLSLQVQQLPWSGAHAKLLTAFAGRDLPDVAQMGNTWLAEFTALGALENLEPRLAGSPVQADDVFAGIWRTNIVNGALVGIPWYVDTRLLFYRRDLLARTGRGAPSTWAQWLDAMEAIKALVGNAGWAALLPLNEYEPLLTLALQSADPLLLDHASIGNFRSAGFRAALAFYAEIFRRGLAPVVSDTELGNLYDEFARGWFSFYVTGPWNLGEFRRRLPATDADIWMTAPMPGPSGPGAGIAGGASLVVFRSSPRKDEAWRLIGALSTRQAQARFYALTGDLPARRDVWAAPPLAGDSKAAAFADQLARARPTPQVPEWERIATEMQRVAEIMVRQSLDVEAAAAEIDRRVDAILAKRRWMLVRSRRAA